MEEKGFAFVVDLKEVEKGFVLVFACPVGLVLKIESPRLGVGGDDLKDSFCMGVGF